MVANLIEYEAQHENVFDRFGRQAARRSLVTQGCDHHSKTFERRVGWRR